MSLQHPQLGNENQPAEVELGKPAITNHTKWEKFRFAATLIWALAIGSNANANDLDSVTDPLNEPTSISWEVIPWGKIVLASAEDGVKLDGSWSSLWWDVDEWSASPCIDKYGDNTCLTDKLVIVSAKSEKAKKDAERARLEAIEASKQAKVARRIRSNLENTGLTSN